MTNFCQMYVLVPLRGRSEFAPRPRDEIIVHFRGNFQNSGRYGRHFYMGAPYPLPGYTRSQTTVSPVINTSPLGR